MHAGKSYKFTEFVLWTRRPLYLATAYGIAAVALHRWAGDGWLAVPWDVVLMLGVTLAVIAGFKSARACGRASEAQRVWASITGISRTWGAMSRDLMDDADDARRMVYRHLAWLTALRYQLRSSREWETLKKAPNAEYRKKYDVPEKESALEAEMGKYVSPDEKGRILVAGSKAAQVLALQSEALALLLATGKVRADAFAELQRVLQRLQDAQARGEQVKDYPYPRQYAIVDTVFLWAFCLLLPFGLLDALQPLAAVVDDPLAGWLTWCVVPLSALIAWMYAALEQVGESTSNPFEGGANDVPISRICAFIEAELRHLLGERDVPPGHDPAGPIVL